MPESPDNFSRQDPKERLLKPARDIRSILRWGYPKFATIRFVAEHSQLSVEERNILTRVIMPPEKVVARIRKKVACNYTNNRDLLLDGYNVLLSVDSLIRKEPMWFCDDGYIRDTRYYFRKTGHAEDVEGALDLILEFLSENSPKSVTFLFDSQISRSGELAGFIRHKLEEHGIPGKAYTFKNC